MEIAQIIDDSLYQYYTIERDLPVPNWRYIKDADWWMQYLIDMGIDGIVTDEPDLLINVIKNRNLVES